MTTLSADALATTHPYLPAGWSRAMGTIRAQGGPWDCDSCGGPSYLCYRCSKCASDLAERGVTTHGRQGGA